MKISAKLLALLMLFGMPLTACGDKDPGQQKPKDEESGQHESGEEGEKEEEEEEEEEEEQGEIVHKGTSSDPYTVSDAYIIYKGLEPAKSSSECYVTGTVSDTPELKGSRLRFHLSDGKAKEDMYVVDINNIGGGACTASTLKKGDTVVAKGAVKCWVNSDDSTTFELCYVKNAAACELVSINGNTSGGGGSGEGGGGGSGEGGGGSATVDGSTFDFSVLASKIGETENPTINGTGLKIVTAKGSGQSAPKCNINKGELRLYIGNTMTISGSDMTSISITANTCGEEKANGTLSATPGSISGFSWTGNANSVTFTVNSGKQVHINKIVVNGEGGGSGEGGGGGSGEGGGTEIDQKIEAIAVGIAEELNLDDECVFWDEEIEEWCIEYIDESATGLVNALTKFFAAVPDGFYAYEEPYEDEDEEGSYAYGSYINEDEMVSIDAYSWEEEGDIVVSVELYEFYWEEE